MSAVASLAATFAAAAAGRRAGALHESSIWLGGAMLLAYGLAPVQAQQVLSSLNGVQRWLPGATRLRYSPSAAGGWLTISSMASG